MKKNSQPSRYTSKLPRVSSIVEYYYPFAASERDRFNNWLSKYGVTNYEYMKEASSGWTFVHSKIEYFINTGKRYRGKQYTWFIESGIQFLIDNNIKPLVTEEYIRTDDYQWTIDLVAEIDWEQWILDWKTFGLAKYAFNIPISPYKKPYDKLKKARLQLSLYAKAKWIKKIWIVELTPKWYHFHVLEIIPDDELITLIQDYKYNYVDEI